MSGPPPRAAAGPAVGPVRLPNPFVLAPMAGVTDLPFRTLCREAGAGLVSTEMISDLALISGSRRSRAILAISPWEHPISCQLCGSRPEEMARAARIAAGAGVDLVDINMGCPAPKIVANNEGAALMRMPSLAVEIVRAVREALPPGIPVTAKIRAGWDEDAPEAPGFAARLERAGAAAVTCHARYRSQFYSGRADWTVIRRVKEALGVPVIGNGDVRSAADALRMIAETGCDAVMIGRGALGNPGLFSECLAAWLGQEPPPQAAGGRAAVAVRHLRMNLALKGPERGVAEMRKHAAWYVRGSEGAAAHRDRLMRAAGVCAIEELLRAALDGTAAVPAPGGRTLTHLLVEPRGVC